MLWAVTASPPAPRSVQVSFIVPLFNCLALTQALLAGLRRTVPPGLAHEIIFVDDGSTDGTRAWLATLSNQSDIRVLLQDRNRGYAAANNRAAALAHGEFLVLLNNDLVLTPPASPSTAASPVGAEHGRPAGVKPRIAAARPWLEPMLAVHRRLGARAGVVGNLQRDARTGALDHAGIFVTLQGKPAHDRDATHLPPAALRWTSRCRRVDAVTGACCVVRRSLWQDLGGFDEGFVNGCEDVDLCLRALARGRINAVALASTVGHHISSSPGRKLRDEANTHRLVDRWRDTLAALAARRWCRAYLESEWTSPRCPTDVATAAHALAHALHLAPTPPLAAFAGLQAALEVEVLRWRGLRLETSLPTEPRG